MAQLALFDLDARPRPDRVRCNRRRGQADAKQFVFDFWPVRRDVVQPIGPKIEEVCEYARFVARKIVGARSRDGDFESEAVLIMLREWPRFEIGRSSWKRFVHVCVGRRVRRMIKNEQPVAPIEDADDAVLAYSLEERPEAIARIMEIVHQDGILNTLERMTMRSILSGQEIPDIARRRGVSRQKVHLEFSRARAKIVAEIGGEFGA